MNTREPDHLNLLCDMGELTTIVTGNSDIETFLASSAALVAQHLKAHVCSIYLFEAMENRLVLRATQGLNPKAVNTVTMKPGEGLVGVCFEKSTIIREGNATQNPVFKYFDNAGEDPFNSFLCVPICSGIEKIGVLVVQHRELDHFTLFDERALRTAMTQLAGAIENARFLMELGPDKTSGPQPGLPPFIKGEPAGTGSAEGQILFPNQNRKSLLYGPDPSPSLYTKADFTAAIERTSEELKSLQERFARRLPESASLIFTAHFMILKDKNFTGRMKQLMDEGQGPISAVKEVAQKYIDLFSCSPHAYMQEKAVDVEDLTIRILANFQDPATRRKAGKGSIAVATEIYPSDILKLVADGIKGIILVGGGVTSHVTILSRSLQIPLIIADDPRLLDLPPETRLLVDATQGNIYFNPDPDTLALFKTKHQTEKQIKTQAMAEQTFSRDKQKVTLLANINLLSEIHLAKALKAEGVGLYRTEFPFLIRTGFPSEAEQYLIYKQLFEQMDGALTTVRTLDAGGEKNLSYSGFTKEANPELGLRSIRFSLKHREVFETQIRAILRAAQDKDNIRLMFPLISSIDEFMDARQIVSDCSQNLDLEGIGHNKHLKIGMMIELPAVLSTIDEFAEMADFFAIGTNDFVQYMTCADRTNKLVADYYIPYHPAVNSGIETIVKAAIRHGIDVSVCGEMAHDPDHIPFLLGVGIRTLSVDPQFLPSVQKIITALSMEEATAYSKTMLAQTRVRAAAQILKTRP
ncbi:MAG: phosphoenolpyruvate--protein phosphotransferase [Proteobacteria bacterium]|nr:phosphoenolpyruvate--protein phosphotransferase [Desulfobacula sp.]MBU4129833.1 phosphoenolpyruvate--protein phosphotransferase [Pseudomonadota bacterium]